MNDAEDSSNADRPTEDREGRELQDVLASLSGLLSDGIATLRVLELVACREVGEDDGPSLETELAQLLGQLHELRRAFELGDITTDEAWEALWKLHAAVPVRPQPADEGDRPSPALLLMSRGDILVDPGPGPPEPTPEDWERLEEVLRHLEGFLEELERRGQVAPGRAEQIRAALRVVADMIAERNPLAWRELIAVLRQFQIVWNWSLGPGRALRGRIANLLRFIGESSPMLRWFLRINVLLWLLFAWDVGSAIGGEIAKMKVNDKETVGTWWGNQIWDLIKGPCPDLLNALSQALNDWRAAQAAGASKEELARALGRVLVLESEYMRRCLPAGSEEHEREARYRELLEDEFRRLTAPAGTGAPPAASEACFVEISLTSVRYEGDDIGHDWELSVTANGVSRPVDLADLSHGSTVVVSPPLVVYSGSFTPCSAIGLVTLTVEARQKHVLGDTVGTNTKLVRPRCPTDADDPVSVWVMEESSFWRTTSSALLTYTFHVRAVCNPT